MKNHSKKLIIGIMSGTSMDGVDGSILTINGDDFYLDPKHKSVSNKIPNKTKDQIKSLLIKGDDELHRASIVAIDIAKLYSQVVKKLLAQNNLHPKDILAIGAHGQTVRHQPNINQYSKKYRYSIQLLNPHYLAEEIGITVVYDFRGRDLAAGGQGAPLIPAFHQAIYQNLLSQGKLFKNKPLAFLNIGGMANLTFCQSNRFVGFDSGPGNYLLDSWFNYLKGKAYDKNGNFAKKGEVNQKLLKLISKHPFFLKKPPKSCGTEDFNFQWIWENIKKSKLPIDDLQTGRDIQATLTELTANSISESISKISISYSNKLHKIIIFGGGVQNKFLLSRLNSKLKNYELIPSDNIGFPAKHMESNAFAWLAWQRINNKPINLSSVTGTKGSRVLGVVC